MSHKNQGKKQGIVRGSGGKDSTSVVGSTIGRESSAGRSSSNGRGYQGTVQTHKSSFPDKLGNNAQSRIPPKPERGNPQTKRGVNPNSMGNTLEIRGNVPLKNGRPHAYTVNNAVGSTNRRPQQNVKNNFQVDDSRTSSPSVQLSSQLQHQVPADLYKEIEKLKAENTRLKAEIDSLTSRLSSFASKQLSAGNPNITDLSDLNRPSKIGENFSQIYDDEWSEAYEGLKTTTKDEEQILKILSSLIQQCFDFASTHSNTQQEQMVRNLQTCMLIQDQQLDKALPPDKNLHSICQRHAKDFRKSAALSSVPGLKKLFKETVLKKSDIYQKLSSTSAGKTHIKSLEDYCDALVQQAWLMRVQDPPMVMCFAKKGEDFRRDEFKEYNKKGKTTKLCVWPSVRLHTDGHLVSKGHVLPV